jgi:hypothetical protein
MLEWPICRRHALAYTTDASNNHERSDASGAVPGYT